MPKTTTINYSTALNGRQIDGIEIIPTPPYNLDEIVAGRRADSKTDKGKIIRGEKIKGQISIGRTLSALKTALDVRAVGTKALAEIHSFAFLAEKYQVLQDVILHTVFDYKEAQGINVDLGAITADSRAFPLQNSKEDYDFIYNLLDRCPSVLFRLTDQTLHELVLKSTNLASFVFLNDKLLGKIVATLTPYDVEKLLANTYAALTSASKGADGNAARRTAQGVFEKVASLVEQHKLLRDGIVSSISIPTREWSNGFIEYLLVSCPSVLRQLPAETLHKFVLRSHKIAALIFSDSKLLQQVIPQLKSEDIATLIANTDPDDTGELNHRFHYLFSRVFSAPGFNWQKQGGGEDKAALLRSALRSAATVVVPIAGGTVQERAIRIMQKYFYGQKTPDSYLSGYLETHPKVFESLAEGSKHIVELFRLAPDPVRFARILGKNKSTGYLIVRHLDSIVADLATRCSTSQLKAFLKVTVSYDVYHEGEKVKIKKVNLAAGLHSKFIKLTKELSELALLFENLLRENVNDVVTAWSLFREDRTRKMLNLDGETCLKLLRKVKIVGDAMRDGKLLGRQDEVSLKVHRDFELTAISDPRLMRQLSKCDKSNLLEIAPYISARLEVKQNWKAIKKGDFSSITIQQGEEKLLNPRALMVIASDRKLWAALMPQKKWYERRSTFEARREKFLQSISFDKGFATTIERAHSQKQQGGIPLFEEIVTGLKVGARENPDAQRIIAITRDECAVILPPTPSSAPPKLGKVGKEGRGANTATTSTAVIARALVFKVPKVETAPSDTHVSGGGVSVSNDVLSSPVSTAAATETPGEETAGHNSGRATPIAAAASERPSMDGGSDAAPHLSVIVPVAKATEVLESPSALDEFGTIISEFEKCYDSDGSYDGSKLNELFKQHGRNQDLWIHIAKEHDSLLWRIGVPEIYSKICCYFRGENELEFHRDFLVPVYGAFSDKVKGDLKCFEEGYLSTHSSGYNGGVLALRSVLYEVELKAAAARPAAVESFPVPACS